MHLILWPIGRLKFQISDLKFRILLGLALSLLGWLSLAVQAQQPKHLVFKDGTTETVEYYRIEGDRVVFKSPEREEEVVPRSQIDWAATEKANADAPLPGKGPRPDVRIITKEERAAAGGKEALIRHQNRQTPEGADLPADAGVYVYIAGAFRRLPESDVALQADKRRKIASLAGLPALKQRQTATLAGPKAAARLKGGAFTFYVDLSDTEATRWRIVRLTAKGDHRELAEILVDLRGQVEMKQQPCAVIARALDNGLIQVKPAQPLPPGEYALIEQAPSNPLQAGSVAIEKKAWDFAVE